MEEQINKKADNSSAGKLKLVLSCCLLGIGLILAVSALFLRASVGKYVYISVEEKNAYITNIDTKTEPPSVYISYTYSPDRYIIGLLPDSEYSETMKEGDWVSIFYNVDSMRQITLNNPYKKSNKLLIFGVLFAISGIIACLICICRKK